MANVVASAFFVEFASCPGC